MIYNLKSIAMFSLLVLFQGFSGASAVCSGNEDVTNDYCPSNEICCPRLAAGSDGTPLLVSHRFSSFKIAASSQSPSVLVPSAKQIAYAYVSL
ncbi:hypothetical protein D9758_011794 [Tetrapyrgos nigripes]|uniref:Uncharacterized protein n=1 Tax=Tetrapyrgos nigripes TaxID=182062 RepID=A0A8H5CY71_9AGAR|nr:hypothetical protein D9758_011794 [Tetrapyrgos nigripes]